MSPIRPALALTVALLAGCVPASMEKLEAQGESVVIASPLHWQQAYRLLNGRAQECLTPASLFGGSMLQVNGQIYDELRMGEIVMTFPTAILSSRNGPFAKIQVEPADSGSTITVLSTRRSPLGETISGRVKMWLEGSTECR